MVPTNLKQNGNLEYFKQPIKNWKTENCSCWLRKDHVQNLGIYICI